MATEKTDKRHIFFGEKGLTSTSANHIANMAKEFTQVKTALVEHLRFVTRNLTVVAAEPGTPMQVSKGMVEDDLKKVQEAYDDIYKANALIAWLREAIKAREAMGNDLKNLNLDDYCELKEIEMPKAPKSERAMTEDDYYATLSMKERSRYYSLETKCAVLGKAIHPDGAFSEARNTLIESVAEPSKLVVKNETTFVENIEPSIDADTIDAFFFRLQDQHRTAQAELNSIKFACEKAVREDEIAKTSAFRTALAEYNAKITNLNADMDLYRKTRAAEISAMKIVIPDSLTAIYEKISGLGK